MRSLSKIVAAIFVLGTQFLSAQDFPYHYFSNSNPLVNNPSFAASESEIRADAGTYNMWAGGFKPLNDYMVSLSMSPDFKKNNHRSGYDRWVGLGAVFLSEKIGSFNQNIFQLIYAYHIPLYKNSFLSFGICAAIENLNIDVNSLSPLHPDDPRLLTGNNSSVIIDGGFGASLHGENYVISFSALNLAGGDFNFKNESAKSIPGYRKFYFSVGYNFELSTNIQLQTAVLFRNSRINSLIYDTSAAFDFNWFAVGAGYRSDNSVFINTKIPVKDFFFTYTSENPLGSKHMVGNGHMISLGWNLKSWN